MEKRFVSKKHRTLCHLIHRESVISYIPACVGGVVADGFAVPEKSIQIKIIRTYKERIYITVFCVKLK